MSGVSTFQLDETGDEGEFRVVKQDARGNVCGAVFFEATEEGEGVRLRIERYDEAEFGGLEVVLS